MPEISPETQRLVKAYQEWSQSREKKEEISTIHVDEVASRLASFYEKIRGVIEWREEHLLKRAAIERSLKRRLLLQSKAEEIAEPLVLELIRGGHFPNDQIEEGKIEEVKEALQKYIYILNQSPAPQKEKIKIQLYDWVLDLCACEIESILSPPIREKALIEYMTEIMKKRINLVGSGIIQKTLPEKEKENQIFIAVQRALFKLDAPLISYHLLEKEYPNWKNLSKADLQSITRNIYKIWQEIEDKLRHPLADRFYNICERYDTIFLILGDIISQNPKEADQKLSRPEILEQEIRKAYQQRLKNLKSKIARAAVFSTISIFTTKMLIAFAIEVPFDKYILKSFNPTSLWFNLLIPPFLMFLLVFTVKTPRKDNMEKVVLEVMKVVYNKERKEIYPIKLPKKRGIILSFFIFVFYLLTFLISFGLIYLGLKKLEFSLLSIAIFIIFFSLIAFAGLKVRERAKELTVIKEKSNPLSILIDTFALPFLRLGKWLSSQWSRFNIIVVFITAFFDMPFHLFVEFLEQWRYFLKEKKEEVH